MARVGHAADALDEILYNADRVAKVKKASGKHTKIKAKEDVLALMRLMHREEIFKLKPGRRLHAFPDFPSNPLAQLDQTEVHDWMTKTVKKLGTVKLFKTPSSRL